MSNDEDESSKKDLKRQKKEYRNEKKRVTAQLVSALSDPTVVVMADFLKIRGTLRKWSRYYCVLKPGLFLIYKSNKTDKNGQWVGTILLNNCELIERPSKKDGFCFKLYHPLDQSVWATRGPQGESHGAITIQPLPTAYLICRAPSDEAGRCWMDGLELSLRCTGLLMRTMHSLDNTKNSAQSTSLDQTDQITKDGESDGEAENDEPKFSETELERHFDGIDDADQEIEAEAEESADEGKESVWVNSGPEVFPGLDHVEQTESFDGENKSIIWTLIKQIRPGMDLSKVVLPTFILEPRSFLEKFADYYYHCDLLTKAALESDPYMRMVSVVRFYLSGFYKKPVGLKKPYNPILGETFRCCWKHPDGSTTYYIAEQVSHHPPISTLFVTNRRAGFNVQGTIYPKSKYYGNSLSAIMDGKLELTLLSRGETYTVTLPYAHCKGILIGTISMELAGPVKIECDKTGYTAELEFNLKPLLSGTMNKIKGRILYGREELSSIDGLWDGQINIKEAKKNTREELWNPTPEVIKKRLPRYQIELASQGDFESEKLWLDVSKAIAEEDQVKATVEKTKLEDDQRARARSGVPHTTKYFEKEKNGYVYKYAEYRPWDVHNDVEQVEKEYVVKNICRVRSQKKRRSQIKQQQASYSSSESDDESPRQANERNEKRDEKRSDQELLKEIQNLGDRTRLSIDRLESAVDRVHEKMALLDVRSILLLFFFFTLFHAVFLTYLTKNSK